MMTIDQIADELVLRTDYEVDDIKVILKELVQWDAENNKGEEPLFQLAVMADKIHETNRNKSH